VSIGFQQLDLNLSTVDYSFGADRRLVIILIAEGDEALHIDFDATSTPSQTQLTLI
jgi:hypothetical protein